MSREQIVYIFLGIMSAYATYRWIKKNHKSAKSDNSKDGAQSPQPPKKPWIPSCLSGNWKEIIKWRGWSIILFFSVATVVYLELLKYSPRIFPDEWEWYYVKHHDLFLFSQTVGIAAIVLWYFKVRGRLVFSVIVIVLLLLAFRDNMHWKKIGNTNSNVVATEEVWTAVLLKKGVATKSYDMSGGGIFIVTCADATVSIKHIYELYNGSTQTETLELNGSFDPPEKYRSIRLISNKDVLVRIGIES